MKKAAEIIGEFPGNGGAGPVHGVSFDGQHVWTAAGDHMRSFDPETGKEVGSLDVQAHAGTAFDGRHLFQIANDIIQKVDPQTGTILATIPAPGAGKDSGLAWSDGSLWVGQYRDQKIVQIDPETGKVLRTIQSDRFVTGVTWVEGELWHGYWDGSQGGILRIDPANGDALDTLEMPPGTMVSGLESDGADRFFAGGGESGKVRIVRRR